MQIAQIVNKINHAKAVKVSNARCFINVNLNAVVHKDKNQVLN